MGTSTHDETADPDKSPRQRIKGPRKKKGLVIVNTGDGKGKTSAALGVLFRAWGRNMRVGMRQVVKHTGAQFGDTARRRSQCRDLREAPLEQPFTAQPASPYAGGRGGHHHQTRRLVTFSRRRGANPHVARRGVPHGSWQRVVGAVER